MAKGRQYAEGLVGPLDRRHYETQRNVAKQTSQTNWEDLQNQYKNLQAKLKKEQEQANRDFANGLVQVAEGSLDRMNTAQDAMATSGLSFSGLNNVMQQADTTRKGQEVLDLMGRAGDVSVNVANQLASANTNSARKQAQLADEIADTLGQIGAGETSAQMAYNQGLAGIGEAMEAREAENDLAAKQRAANAAASARGGELDEWNKKLDEAYRRQAILDVLQSKDLDDTQKGRVLQTLYGIDNASDAVESFKAHSGKSTKKTEYDAISNKVNSLRKNSTFNDVEEYYDKIADGKRKGPITQQEQIIYDYINGDIDNGLTDEATSKMIARNLIATEDRQGNRVMETSNINKTAKALRNLKKLYENGDMDKYNSYSFEKELPYFANYTYGELAELLYGKK